MFRKIHPIWYRHPSLFDIHHCLIVIESQQELTNWDGFSFLDNFEYRDGETRLASQQVAGLNRLQIRLFSTSKTLFFFTTFSSAFARRFQSLGDHEAQENRLREVQVKTSFVFLCWIWAFLEWFSYLWWVQDDTNLKKSVPSTQFSKLFETILLFFQRKHGVNNETISFFTWGNRWTRSDQFNPIWWLRHVIFIPILFYFCRVMILQKNRYIASCFHDSSSHRPPVPGGNNDGFFYPVSLIIRWGKGCLVQALNLFICNIGIDLFSPILPSL